MESTEAKPTGDNANLFALQSSTKTQGMQSLDREAFRKVIKLPALRIEANKCSVFRKKLQKVLLNQPRLKNIVPDEVSGNRAKEKIMLLHPGKPLDQEGQSFAESHNAVEIEYDLVVGYDYWTTEQVLRAILPPEIAEVPSGFETIGHIAHVNLRDTQLEFKNIIGQVILDKNSPQIKTVVNKTNTIDETFRFFKMEVLAGENNLQTSVTQDGFVYEFDFSKVYWNSRLQTEHKRLVTSFHSDDVMCDMFAGVGPFAIPAAKKGCFVYANDLNSSSYTALVKNAKLNHVDKNIQAYNIDGREFVRKVVNNALNSGSSCNSKNRMFGHVVLNLPASAVQFLDVFKGLFADYKDIFSRGSISDEPELSLPMIHCYCFSKSDDPYEDVQKQAEEVLGVEVGDECEVYNVRNVAPKKVMMCVSFRLPKSVAFADKVTQECVASKRQSENDEKELCPKHQKVAEC